MKKHAVVVSAAAAVMGLAALVLGFAAAVTERRSQALVSQDGFRCVYRRTAALGFGVAAAGLSLAALLLLTAASGCFARCGTRRKRSSCVIRACAIIVWLVLAATTAMFLYGASRNRGRTGGLSPVAPGPGGWIDGRSYVFGCPEPSHGFFSSAAMASAVAIGCAIAVYLDLQRPDIGEPFVHTVTLGQPQWSSAQPYPPPPAVGSAPPPYGGHYGARHPAETA